MDEIKNTHKISTFDIAKIRNDFPILNQKVYGEPLIYFDNGATTQKPRVVIDIISKLHSEYNSNVHRGVHYLSEQITKMYELAREKICQTTVVQDCLDIAHKFSIQACQALEILPDKFLRSHLVDLAHYVVQRKG